MLKSKDNFNDILAKDEISHFAEKSILEKSLHLFLFLYFRKHKIERIGTFNSRIEHPKLLDVF